MFFLSPYHGGQVLQSQAGWIIDPISPSRIFYADFVHSKFGICCRCGCWKPTSYSSLVESLLNSRQFKEVIFQSCFV